MKNKIKVLIIDDSALIRQTLTKVLSEDEDIEVIGVAADPYIAVNKIKTNKPDVITLDIQMPKMDGLTFLRKLMSQHPIPVIIISSLTAKDSKIALTAYKLGAIDVIHKPIMSSEIQHSEWKEKLLTSIKTASESKVKQKVLIQKTSVDNQTNEKSSKNVKKIICNSLILIGSSAGGTEVINNILSRLEPDSAPILIVQHMPIQFTGAYATRLNNNSQLTIKEASRGDELNRGLALLAPGDKHMEIKNNGFNFFVELNSNEKVNRHRPSVDVLFKSALSFPGVKMMAIILSGMGKDGTVGMMELKNEGAVTIAQNEKSCVVYGMPKEATISGAATYSLDIDEIIIAINEFSRRNR